MNSKHIVGKTVLSLMMLVFLLFVGCFDSVVDTLNQAMEDSVVAPIDSNVSLGNTEFGFNLFNTIWNTEQNQNIFLSPFSVSTALAMTLNGAAGETEQAMIDTLQLQGITTDSINSSYYQLLQTLQTSDPKVTLTIANSLWGHEGVPFKQDFQQRNSQYFNAEISTLDFADPNSLTTINQWVNTNTNGKIKKILDEIESNAVLFLINAIYFKGTWQTEFDPSATSDRKFHLVTGSTKQVPMMSRKGDFAYYENSEENFQAISLPYGEGKMGMYIFLPSSKSNLNTFIQTLTAENLENWISELQEQEVMVYFPKFKLEYGTKELNDALTSLGMGVAFDEDSADFSRMAHLDDIGGNLYIQKVAHKTFIEVNEEGSEAAAATSVGIGVKSILRTVFNADRPFFFAIRDNQTQTVLFMGTVVDP
ncbi:MAG: serpin family protein [Candidatus Poribacteria bacterium]|nr:serpin family protein [Candidatus Poribacteria bacterium]